MKNEAPRRIFADLSIHQRMMFLHKFTEKTYAWLPKIRRDVLHLDHTRLTDRDLLLHIPLYRALRFANDPDNAHILPGIYRSLNPEDQIKLPPRFRCNTIIMMILVQLYNQFYPRHQQDRLLDLCRKILLEFRAVNEDEAANLSSVFTFIPDAKILNFQFQDEEYRIQLNPSNGYGYELTLIPKK